MEHYWYKLHHLLQDGFAPLHAASQEGHEYVVELLVRKGASIYKETEVKFSSVGAIHLAALWE